MTEVPKITQEMINLYDEYTHITLDRRAFIDKLTALVGSTATALAVTSMIEANGAAAQMVKEGDSRRISGFAAIYTLLKLIGDGKGQVLRYDRGITDQFNSTVTYASMAFF